MRKRNTHTTNQTFSLPTDISYDLHTYVKRRERSHFVAEAIRKELKRKKDSLRKSYLQANTDQGQTEASEEWEGTLLDGEDEW